MAIAGAVALVSSCAWLLYLGVRGGTIHGRRDALAVLARPRADWWIIPASVVVVVGTALAWQAAGLEPTYQVRLALMLSALAPLALTDQREHVVPNEALIALLGARVVIYVWEAVAHREIVGDMIRAELITAVVVVIFFIMVRMLNKGGIGMGDIKLFGVMTLFLGTQLALASIFASLLVSFVVAVVAMASKRKTRKDSFAMVPSIALGTALAVVLVSIRGAL
ncbi:prepilin peptidase [Sanguibacter sp. A247]|uniref:prepilin peptidase n=1 Tax=unclassified Sanguibacter TaxID=2645534 RepID=UPI003FD7EC37